MKNDMLTTSTPMSAAYISALTLGLRKSDVRCDAGDAEAVDRRADGRGDVRAVTVLVDVVGVDATSVGVIGTGAVDQRNVDGEVATQFEVEVGLDVGVVTVDSGVEDADPHLPAAALHGVRTLRRCVDHRARHAFDGGAGVGVLGEAGVGGLHKRERRETVA